MDAAPEFCLGCGRQGRSGRSGGRRFVLQPGQGNYDYYSSGQMPNMYSALIDTPWAAPTGLTFSDLKNVDPFSSLASDHRSIARSELQ